MDIAVKSDGSHTVVALQGRFDAHEADPVRERLVGAISAGAMALTLDLSGVTFIDSKALALLVRSQKECREGGIALTLASPSSPVQLIFELTKLDRAFHIVDEPTLAESA